jgi:hypothetical protein
VGNSRGELEELVTLRAWVERRSWWKRLLVEGQATSSGIRANISLFSVVERKRRCNAAEKR